MRRIATAVLTAAFALGVGGLACHAEEGAPAGSAPAKVDLKLPAADAASIAAQGEAKAAASGGGAVPEASKDSAAGAAVTEPPAAAAPAAAPAHDEGSKKVKTAKASSPVKSSGETAEEKIKRLRDTFATFCDSWVDKLRERQRNNLANIKWRTSPEGVIGEYVGYDTDHVGPQSVEHPDETPIGKLIYIELKLRLAGPTEAHALAQEPEVIERTEVTELFRFNQGTWVY